MTTCIADTDAIATSRFWQTRIAGGRKPPHPPALPQWKTGMHQCLSWMERQSYRAVTRRFPLYPSIWKLGCHLATEIGWRPAWDVWRLAMSATVLRTFWQDHGLPRTVVLIGDGYGFLAALLSRLCTARIWSVELPDMMPLQIETFRRAHAPIVVLSPREAAGLPEWIDCAVNVCSMQEMTEANVAFYFRLLRPRSAPQSHFYCVNRLEKDLGADGVRRFHEYPWTPQDTVYLDEPCPYFRHRFLTRAPYRVRFEICWHRLVHLAPACSEERAR